MSEIVSLSIYIILRKTKAYNQYSMKKGNIFLHTLQGTVGWVRGGVQDGIRDPKGGRFLMDRISHIGFNICSTLVTNIYIYTALNIYNNIL